MSTEYRLVTKKVLLHFVAVLSLFSCLGVNAQQFHFSQYRFTDQRLNPAIVGIGTHWQLEAVHRQQRAAEAFDIASTSFSYSRPLLKPNDGGNFGGFGVSFLDDRSGSGFFRIQEAGLSYAFSTRTTENSYLSAGASIFYQRRRAGFSDFLTASQYVRDRGFDRTLASGENLEGLEANFYRINAGVHWEQQDANGRRINYLGIAAFDLNKPNPSFQDDSFELVNSWMAYGGFEIGKYLKTTIYSESLVSKYGGSYLFNTGIRWNYLLASEGAIDLLSRYVFGRELMLGVQFTKGNLTVGMSYDVPVNGNNAGNQGTFEFGLELRGLVISKSKEKRERKRRTPRDRRRKKEKEIEQDTTQQRVETPQENEQNRPEEVEEEQPPVVDSNNEKTEGDSTVVSPEDENEKRRGRGRVGEMSRDPYRSNKLTLGYGFEFNTFNLNEESKEELGVLAKRMINQPDLRLSVVGHTDDIGTEEINQWISEKRANAVKEFLVSQGVSADRIIAEGKGELLPKASNATAKGRAINRRVEILVERK